MKWKLFKKVINCRELRTVKVYDESGNLAYEMSMIAKTFLIPQSISMYEIEPDDFSENLIREAISKYEDWKWRKSI